jgi:2-C-methyl-D-erythritol 4-phosphate cytidylyltransferase
MPRALAVIVAGGKGERMAAGVPKAFIPLAGVPMILHSVRVFEAAPSVTAIVAVVPADRVEDTRALLPSLGTPVTVVAGGERRQDSVRAGLEAAPAGFDGIVLVHDAARPLVELALVEAIVLAAAEAGAAIPVLPLADTIKRVEGGLVQETVDRAALGAAQTPQGFSAGLLKAAYDAADRDGALLTDESVAVERVGGSVRAIPGSPANRKLTTPDDLAWAEDLLRRRGGA